MAEEYVRYYRQLIQSHSNSAVGDGLALLDPGHA